MKRSCFNCQKYRAGRDRESCRKIAESTATIVSELEECAKELASSCKEYTSTKQLFFTDMEV